VVVAVLDQVGDEIAHELGRTLRAQVVEEQVVGLLGAVEDLGELRAPACRQQTSSAACEVADVQPVGDAREHELVVCFVLDRPEQHPSCQR
jgi:hypothetical protein